jgi:hypothetical protein
LVGEVPEGIECFSLEGWGDPQLPMAGNYGPPNITVNPTKIAT